MHINISNQISKNFDPSEKKAKLKQINKQIVNK